MNQAREVQQELQTRLLSLEYQNSKLSKKLRLEEAQFERTESLHRLQLQERDLLLAVLVDQVKELRATAARQEAIQRLSAPPAIPVRENVVSKTRAGDIVVYKEVLHEEYC